MIRKITTLVNNILILSIALFIIACNSNTSKPQFSQPVEGRAELQLNAFIEKRLNSFSAEGEWLREEQIRPRRSLEPLALAHVFLASGNQQAVEQANFYLANAKDLEWYKANYILLKYPKLLSEASKQNIKTILDRIAPQYLADHWDFVEVNDNFPSMAACGCALYGQLTGKIEYTNTAIDRLIRFGAQLKRSGVNSEYSSQAYCFLQIEGMAMIAEMTDNTQLRELALKTEAYFWRDVLGHFYMPARKMSAPYCRAYAWDMRGEGLAYSLYEQVLGDMLPFMLLDDYFDPSEEWIKCRNATCYDIEYHCPQELVDSLKNRKYPYSFIAVADGSPSSDNMEMEIGGVSPKTRQSDVDDGIIEYPAWKTRIETYMTPKYSISTSTVPFHSGSQTENFSIVYPKKGFSENYRNTSTIFCRLVINNQETLLSQTDGYGDYGVVYNELGRRMTVGELNTAMVLYKPKAGFSKAVEDLRVSIYIPNADWMRGNNTIDEIWIGDNKISNDGGSSKNYETIFIKDGDVYMAYIPLVAAKLDVEEAVMVENRSGYTILSFYNYKGKPKDFSKRGFMNIGNGFVCEIASDDEYESFEKFRSMFSQAKVTDYYRINEHYRSNSVRYTKYERHGLTLENEYSPVSEGIRFSTVNGYYR